MKADMLTSLQEAVMDEELKGYRHPFYFSAV